VDEALLCRVFRDAFAARLGIRFREGELTPAEEEIKSELMAKRYGSENWSKEGSAVWTSGR